MSYFNSISRINAPDVMSFIDSPDPVYGTGADGSLTLDGTTTVLGMSPSSGTYGMTRDIYAFNLTIEDDVWLKPNGYRIFVKNLLTLNTGARIGFTAGFATSGSIKQGAGSSDSWGAVTHSLGGNSSTATATPPTEQLGGSDYFKQPHQAITGYSITASGGPTFLRGGAAGGVDIPGGGIVIISARNISGPVSGSASISAPGTGGAGGGVILVVSSGVSLPAGVSTDVTGHASGTFNYMQLV